MAANPKALAPDLAKKVADWDIDCRCIPSFEAMRDVEYLRALGTHNMLTDDIVRGMYDLGLYAGALWVNECRENRRSWQKNFALGEKMVLEERGPRHTWLTPDVIRQYEVSCAENQISNLSLKIAELQREQEELRSRTSRGSDRSSGSRRQPKASSRRRRRSTSSSDTTSTTPTSS